MAALLVMDKCWGSPRGRLYHMSVDCARRRPGARVLSEQEIAVRRPCGRCVRVCHACWDMHRTMYAFDCDHVFCEDCVRTPVGDAAKRRSHIVCPCGGRLRECDARLHTLYVESLATDDPPRVAVDDALSLHCPHCHGAFLDFDGCLALQCHCGGYFCGLCLHTFGGVVWRASHPDNQNAGIWVLLDQLILPMLIMISMANLKEAQYYLF